MAVDQIVEELLQKAVYTRVPIVSITAKGVVTLKGGVYTTLTVWYDDQVHENARTQYTAMERFMVDCFSSGGNLLAKRYKNTSPYTSLEEAREIFGEDATIENASALLNAIEPEEWVVQKIYQMDGKREEFEKNYLSKIGAIITLTSDSFARYHSRLKKTRSNIVTYWGEQVLDSELSEFANEHPDIWEEWNEFFVNDGRDLFIDPQGKQVSPEQVIDLSDEEIVSAGYQRYAPVQAAHKVAEQLAVFSTSLLRDIERVHKGESTTFILEKEIDILSIP